MGPSAVDRARQQWGIDPGVPVVLEGSGSSQLFEDARKTVRGLMPQLVGLDGVVRKATLAALDELLTSFGLEKTGDQPYNPPGRQLFYRKGLLLIRIKTKGNSPKAKYRANQPHLSVGLMKDPADDSFQAEVVKFSPTGRARPKATRADKEGTLPPLLPVTATNGKVSYSGDEEQWAKMTHFNFPPGVTEVV
jgi:hypothetical protein